MQDQNDVLVHSPPNHHAVLARGVPRRLQRHGFFHPNNAIGNQLYIIRICVVPFVTSFDYFPERKESPHVHRETQIQKRLGQNAGREPLRLLNSRSHEVTTATRENHCSSVISIRRHRQLLLFTGRLVGTSFMLMIRVQLIAREIDDTARGFLGATVEVIRARTVGDESNRSERIKTFDTVRGASARSRARIRRTGVRHRK